MRTLCAAVLVSLALPSMAQFYSAIHTTNPLAKQILLGNYNPADYAATKVISHPDSIIQGLISGIQPDSMLAYLDGLRPFGNRNSGSDTVTPGRGIGGARRWAVAKFGEFSAASENRLVTSYLEFNTDICGMKRHRNPLAILPGTNPAAAPIIIEAHIDSRCEGSCDTACTALGMDDNGSGTVLVMELARTMSKYSFNNTIVFMLTIGEEQGLIGAKAMSKYCRDSLKISLKVVLNNDILGGITCGQTASAPKCPFNTPVDSINLRLFSFGLHNSPHKQLARFTRLQYNEMTRPRETVKLDLHVMSPEDRSGRGGDHIPFRQDGFPAMRHCVANEHGDANSSDPGYTDNQHSERDILGWDLDTNGTIDTFFVDFNYMRRNALVNATTAVMASQGPEPIAKPVLSTVPGGLIVSLTDPNNYGKYRVACRFTTSVDWDTLVTFDGVLTDTIWGLPELRNRIDSTTTLNTWWISAATMDSIDVESLFSGETSVSVLSGIGDMEGEEDQPGLELHQNRPNPFDEGTTMAVTVHRPVNYEKAEIVVYDLAGREVSRLPISLKNEVNEVVFWHGLGATGTYLYSLVVDGKVLDTKRMVFAY